MEAPKSSDQRYQLRGPPREYKDDAVLYRDVAEVWARSSLQMARLCAGLGIEYFHFLQPNQYVEGSKPLTEEELRKAINPSQPYRSGVEEGYPELQRLGAELARNGVAFHDATGVFAEVQQSVYFDDCCHFNIVGNRVLARFVARAIGAAAADSR